MKHICIYCKQEKDEEQFNKEHVVPRMMGRYAQGLVLSNFQVCKQCNTFFSKEIEDKISLDSYEALLRMKFGTKKMSKDRKLRNNRLTITGAEGLFRGLPLSAVSNPSSPERVAFDIEPCVGVKVADKEYKYFTIEELPYATKEVMERLISFDNPIIQFGYEKEVVEKVLREKGYINDDVKYTKRATNKEYNKSKCLASIRFSIDSIVRRVSAKTIFNYLCFNTSSEYVLDSKYDAIRNYIRYGERNGKLWCRYSTGYISGATPPNNTSHMVGTMLNFGNGLCELLGCVTWFGEMTYIMKICDVIPISEYTLDSGMTVKEMPKVETKFTYFDNEAAVISEQNATFIYSHKSRDLDA